MSWSEILQSQLKYQTTESGFNSTSANGIHSLFNNSLSTFFLKSFWGRVLFLTLNQLRDCYVDYTLETIIAIHCRLLYRSFDFPWLQ